MSASDRPNLVYRRLPCICGELSANEHPDHLDDCPRVPAQEDSWAHGTFDDALMFAHRQLLSWSRQHAWVGGSSFNELRAISPDGGRIVLADGWEIELQPTTWDDLDDAVPGGHHRFYPKPEAARRQAILDGYNATRADPGQAVTTFEVTVTASAERVITCSSLRAAIVTDSLCPGDRDLEIEVVEAALLGADRRGA